MHLCSTRSTRTQQCTLTLHVCVRSVAVFSALVRQGSQVFGLPSFVLVRRSLLATWTTPTLSVRCLMTWSSGLPTVRRPDVWESVTRGRFLRSSMPRRLTVLRNTPMSWSARSTSCMVSSRCCAEYDWVLAQSDLLVGKHGLPKRFSPLARVLNEIAAYLHFPALSTELTVFTQDHPSASDTWKCCSSHVSQIGGHQIPRGGPTRVSYVAVCIPSSSRCFLRRTRNPTPISALRANMSFVRLLDVPCRVDELIPEWLNLPTRSSRCDDTASWHPRRPADGQQRAAF